MQHLKKFLDYFSNHGQIALPAIEKTHLNQKESVEELAEVMLPWAENHLGENWVKNLVDGYIYMLMDVNRSQAEYERRGKYLNKNYLIKDLVFLLKESVQLFQLIHLYQYLARLNNLYHLKLRLSTLIMIL